MVTKSDTVILKNWPMGNKSWNPKRGINVKYHLIDKKNQECYATLFGSDKQGITQDDINSELVRMSKHLLSDRARTVKNKPKFNVINGITETIQ